MVSATDRDGNAREFSLDIDYIIGLENADASYSFMEDVQRMSEKLRIANLDRLCRAIGSDIKTMLSMGFTIDAIADIFTECLREAGFISAKPEQQPSSAEEE